MRNREAEVLRSAGLDADHTELYLSAEQIQSRVGELAHDVSRRYKDQLPILIGILNGSFVFMADLVRMIEIDVEVDFLKISSYGNRQESSGTVRLLKDISGDITGRDVVIVEDIIDTGLTIRFLRQRMMEAAASSVTFITLLLKEKVATLDFPIDYVGFNIDDRYFVGYGLDSGQKLRGLGSIYAIKEK